MADPNLSTALAKQAKEKAALEKKEDAAAAANALPEGKVRVRLIRGKTTKNGEYLPPGIYDLDEDEIPKTAKRLKVGAPEDEKSED